MSAVSKELISTLIQLQKIKSLRMFALGGGANLVLRYQHRESRDIDLFSNHLIGIKGFEIILKELKISFGDKLLSSDFPCKINDQFVFLRCFILKNGITIKVEFLQNMKTIDVFEEVDKLWLISKKDIGLFKLISVSNRYAKKDIYDLDYITDEIPLIELFDELIKKKSIFNQDTDKTIFDLDGESSPIKNPELLLGFDKIENAIHPNHSSDVINYFQGKTWNHAKFNWRLKVRELFRHLNIPFPNTNPIDLT